MLLNKQPVPHVVDTQNQFSAAMFLREQSTHAVWNVFLYYWAMPYIGYPEPLRVGHGSQFILQKFQETCEITGIRLIYSGVESHNSIGSGERYHDPLRRMYQKIRFSEPDIALDLTMRLSVKAINDTMDPEGLIPSLLVFGVLPRFPAFSTTP